MARKILKELEKSWNRNLNGFSNIYKKLTLILLKGGRGEGHTFKNDNPCTEVFICLLIGVGGGRWGTHEGKNLLTVGATHKGI